MHSSAPDNPANERLCRYLRAQGARNAPDVARPVEFARPYDQLGTHPELVARLWDETTTLLPRDCRFVLFGHPVLMHPVSDVVFGYAGGTQRYAFRLPEPVRTGALAAGATRVFKYRDQAPFDLAVFGDEWVFGGWFKDEGRWCLSAYEFAGGLDIPPLLDGERD